MTTVKEILSANRESVISSIKFAFKVYTSEDIKAKMIEFLQFAEANANVEKLSTSKRIKTDLKELVIKMNRLSMKSQPKMKLADILAGLAEQDEDQKENN